MSVVGDIPPEQDPSWATTIVAIGALLVVFAAVAGVVLAVAS